MSSCQENSPIVGGPPCPGISFVGANTASIAPCGSVKTAKRPTVGMSVGVTQTVPPCSVARFTVASTSPTPTYPSQCDGAPAALASAGSCITPPSGRSPVVHMV